jgi:hypothetical protein
MSMCGHWVALVPFQCLACRYHAVTVEDAAMFVSDRLVYLELHKTGCSHIRSLLNEILPGELRPIHLQAPHDLFTAGRMFLGSVRSPWSWYTSLWGFGCDSKGGVFGSVTRSRGSIRGLGWAGNARPSPRSGR